MKECIDDKIERLLGLPLPEKDGEIQLTEAHKKMIHEISKMCGNIPVVRRTKERSEDYAKDLTAEQVYIDMLHKIVEAPTKIHMELTTRILIPVIDRKLEEGE